MEWWIITTFFSFLHKKRVPAYLAAVLGGILTVMQFLLTNIFLTNTPLIVAGSFVYALLLSLLYVKKWYWHILESLVMYMVIAIPEIMFAMALQLLLNVDVNFLQTNMAFFAICTFTTKFISLLIVMSLRLTKIKKSISASGKAVLPILLLPVATIMIIAQIIQSGYINPSKSFMMFSIFSTVLLMVANIVIFWIIGRQQDYIQTKESLRYAQAHIQTQVDHYKELYQYHFETRAFRHDNKNRLIALSGLLQAGDVEKAQALIENELEATEKAAKSVIHSGNPVLDAVLQSKRKLAESKNVQLNTRILIEEPIRMDEMELGVLIGNAIDNAIEAAEKITDADTERVVRVQIRSLMGRIWISVDNPTVEEKGSVSALHSTKPDSRNHGYGLKSIQSIIDTHDGTLSITWEQHRFTIEMGLSN